MQSIADSEGELLCIGQNRVEPDYRGRVTAVGAERRVYDDYDDDDDFIMYKDV